MRRVFWIGLLCLMLTACGASDVTEETEYTEPATVCVEIETEATVPSGVGTSVFPRSMIFFLTI